MVNLIKTRLRISVSYSAFTEMIVNNFMVPEKLCVIFSSHGFLVVAMVQCFILLELT
jgi:hypothetical protein